ncbi:hypothetical protein [Paenibacillus paeoniae]|uniref:Peptidyl-prolyl cis-trans isomerase n=1 Tax=Paenibacillus paeoniae TaxID=2292705 RepID=A0A371P6R4_9BACL|nr:hypothetical protein [Paenibacillus paeoniae]REK71218.1 hypothetical protein DX130_22500 [Paenibacillus paeoniae]
MNRSKARLTVIAIAAGVSLIIGVVLLMTWKGALFDDAAVAEVNGQPITAAEFTRALHQQRSAVIDYYMRTYGAEMDTDFWNTDYSGETPAHTLKELALESAVRLRLQLILAESQGIIQGSSYNELLAEMERENARRKAAQEAREPVYGPIRFDETNFPEFYISRIWNELREKLSQDELAVEDEQLMQHYEQIKDELFKLEDNIRFHSIKVSYTEDGQRIDGKLKQQAEVMMNAIRERLEQAESIEDIVKELEESDAGPSVLLAIEPFNDDTARYYFKSLPKLYEWLAGGQEAGRISPVMDDRATGQYVMALVIDREAGGYRSFAEQKDNVRKHYLNVVLAAYLDERMGEAEVNKIASRYDRIKVN